MGGIPPPPMPPILWAHIANAPPPSSLELDEELELLDELLELLDELLELEDELELDEELDPLELDPLELLDELGGLPNGLGMLDMWVSWFRALSPPRAAREGLRQIPKMGVFRDIVRDCAALDNSLLNTSAMRSGSWSRKSCLMWTPP